MIVESDIRRELEKLNAASAKFEKTYDCKEGNNGSWGLFDVKENVYRPVYMADTPSGFFAYVNLLKNLYEKGKITN